VARITVFGAGAMGTALAVHLARLDEEVALWGSEFDSRVLPSLRDEGTHPALPGRLPDSVRVFGPDELEEASKGLEIAVMGANSAGARSLAGLVSDAVPRSTVVVSIAKGLEPDTAKRMTEVYAEVLGHPVVAVGGPALAPEVAEAQPCVAVFASEDREALSVAVDTFRSKRYAVDTTEDCTGLEYCGTAKNVGAIGAGIIEGLAAGREQANKNARAVLFTRAVHEMADLVERLGGRRDTALGLAGMGDLLVTSLGGRNRQFGEVVGTGANPQRAEREMEARGMTVEGVESAKDVHTLAEGNGLDLPVHEAVYRVIHDRKAPESILEAVR
jgi:glycerol-3-phosphate dehydrogenase (NAD(P)+)